jgi:hypothetical protein
MSGEIIALAGSQTQSNESELFVGSEPLNSAAGTDRSKSMRQNKIKLVQGIKISNRSSCEPHEIETGKILLEEKSR